MGRGNPIGKIFFVGFWSFLMWVTVVAIQDDEKFVPQDGKPLAKLQKFERAVQYRPEGYLLWGGVFLGQTLFEGDSLATSDGSQAVIKFFNGRVLELGENSQIEIALNDENGSGDLSVTLLRGNVSTHFEAPEKIPEDLAGPEFGLFAKLAREVSDATAEKKPPQTIQASDTGLRITAGDKNFLVNEKDAELAIGKKRGESVVSIDKFKGNILQSASGGSAGTGGGKVAQNWAVVVFTPTPLPTATPKPPPTAIVYMPPPPTPSVTQTPLPKPTATETAVPLPTSTPTQTATARPTATGTQKPTQTGTSTATATVTATATKTAPPTLTATPSATSTPALTLRGFEPKIGPKNGFIFWTERRISDPTLTLPIKVFPPEKVAANAAWIPVVEVAPVGNRSNRKSRVMGVPEVRPQLIEVPLLPIAKALKKDVTNFMPEYRVDIRTMARKVAIANPLLIPDVDFTGGKPVSIILKSIQDIPEGRVTVSFSGTALSKPRTNNDWYIQTGGTNPDAARMVVNLVNRKDLAALLNFIRTSPSFDIKEGRALKDEGILFVRGKKVIARVYGKGVTAKEISELRVRLGAWLVYEGRPEAFIDTFEPRSGRLSQLVKGPDRALSRTLFAIAGNEVYGFNRLKAKANKERLQQLEENVHTVFGQSVRVLSIDRALYLRQAH